MAGAQSAQNIFPISYKTAAVSDRAADTIVGTGANAAYSYIGFQLYQPYNLYKMKGLKLHFKCTFAGGVITANQVVQKISVGTALSGFPSTTTPFLLTNFVAVGGTLEFTIDLSTLMTPTGDDTIYLFFPAAMAFATSGVANSIVLGIMKVDMLYQTIGIR